MEKLVSIIIPVYNRENTIRECIESALSQTYKNIEIVIVNDGSADNTDRIVKELIEKYNNIKYICKENGGVSSARNVGIENAEGEYIVFLDSDDTLDKQFLSEMLAQMSDDVLPICGINVQYESVSLKHLYNENEKISSVPVKDIAFVYGKYLLSSAANKMYSRKVIVENNISFPTDVANGEDLIFNLLYAEYIKEFKIVNQLLYNYSVSEDDTLHSTYEKKRFYYISRMYASFTDLLKKLDCSIESFEIVKRMIMAEYVLAIRIYLKCSSDKFGDKVKTIRKIFRSSEYSEVKKYLDNACTKSNLYYMIKLESPILLTMYYHIAKMKK